MIKDFVAVFDSGIGGLNILDRLVFEFPNENFIYFGDNKNAPYGVKSDRELLGLTFDNLQTLFKHNIKLIVIACNTISVNVLPKLKNLFGVPIIGVIPPIEKQIAQKKKTLLLATDRTADKYKGQSGIKTVGLSNLVKEIELNVFNLDRVDLSNFLPRLKEGFDSILISCTHFIYLKKAFLKFLTTKSVFDGVDECVTMASKYLKKQKSLDISLRNKVLFVGENKELNQKVWENIF